MILSWFVIVVTLVPCALCYRPFGHRRPQWVSRARGWGATAVRGTLVVIDTGWGRVMTWSEVGYFRKKRR